MGGEVLQTTFLSEAYLFASSIEGSFKLEISHQGAQIQIIQIDSGRILVISSDGRCNVAVRDRTGRCRLKSIDTDSNHFEDSTWTQFKDEE